MNADARAEAEGILAQWADVERVLNRAKVNLSRLAQKSDEAVALRVEIDRLIELWATLWMRYQRLVERAADKDEPAPPPWPGPADVPARP